MKAVILAAGEGKRLRPFTHSEPKVMIPVANKPIIEHVVDSLVSAGVKDILIVVGYKRQSIMTHLKDGGAYGANIEYVIQEKQLGTAHALFQARDMLPEEYMVMPGDNIISSDGLKKFLGEAEGPSILLTHSDQPSKYGVAELSGDRVKRLEEKPEKAMGNLINTGVYVLSKAFAKELDSYLEEGVVGLSDTLNHFIPKRNLKGIVTEGPWFDAVYPWDLLDLNFAALKSVSGSVAGKIENGVHMKGDVRIGEGTTVRSGAYITGPVIIGCGCEIGPNAVISPSTSIGDNSVIGPHSTVSNSLLMEDVCVGAGTIIEDSVIGSGVRFGPNCSVVSGQARVLTEKECHDLERIGAMIADDTQVGPLSSFAHGVIIGWNCDIGSNVKVLKNLEDATVMV